MGGEDVNIINDKEFYGTETNTSGLYSDIVAEFDMGVLPVNAILCYQSLISGENIENNSSDEKSVCFNAFKKIQNMIKT